MVSEQEASPRILKKYQRTASPRQAQQQAQQIVANPVTHGFSTKKKKKNPNLIY